MKENRVPQNEGILLIDKPKGCTSFSLVSILRKRLGIKKIGHAGTLDPLATGLMVMLIGRNYTRLSDQFLVKDKEYRAQVHLGISTDTYDAEGAVLSKSEHVPTKEEVEKAIAKFQGKIEQVPPMFSAKKVNGKKLCDLARKGKEIDRKAVSIEVHTEFLGYQYPFIELNIRCSKGTYIRSIANDLGIALGCGAYLSNLIRTRSGNFVLDGSVTENELKDPQFDLGNKIFKQ